MISAVIVGAGCSSRCGKDKLELILGGVPVIMRTLFAFQSCSEIDEMILVVQKEKVAEYQDIKRMFSKITHVIAGGKTRTESAYLGIQATSSELVIVHSAANPLVTHKEILELIKVLPENKAGFVGRSVSSTIRLCKNGSIESTLDRSMLTEAESPQGVSRSEYLKAYKSLTDKERTACTDEMMLMEKAGILGVFIPASVTNRKITVESDIAVLESFLSPRIRTGIGHDSHKFGSTKIKPLIIGGVEIPYDKNFEANSDGDVLTHALCNAIGTAIGEGSLSKYADSMLKNEGIIDSFKYLEHIVKNMQALGYNIGNIACSLEGKYPKLEAHIPSMKRRIAEFLHIGTLQVGIACTSGEDLTSFGKGEGVQCFCIVTLIKNTSSLVV